MLRFLIYFVLLLTSCSVMGGNSRSVPVQFGGEAEGDGCPLGEVRLHEAIGKADIRSGPGSAYNVIDKISDGDRIFVCDKSVAGRGWVGVVYGDEDVDDCDFTFSKPSSRSDYQGDCQSGWIEKENVGDLIFAQSNHFDSVRVLVPREGCKQGQVAGLKKYGDGHLSVRAGPGTSYETVHLVNNGDPLYICQTDESGIWMGVVYLPAPLRGIVACDLENPSVLGHPYVGGCSWGWVHRNWVRTGKP